MRLQASGIPQTNLFQSSICKLASWAFVLVVVAPTVLAQQLPAAPDSQPAPPQTQPTTTKASEIPPVSLFLMLNRKSIVFPDIASNAQRLSPEKKFELFVDNSISLNALAGAAFGSGLAQAADTPTGFGQGSDGYAKRFGSSMARQAS